MKNPTHILRAIRFLIMTGAGLVMIHFLVRVFVADRFIVRGESMSPTLVDGKPVYVNKLTYGARIYTSFDFECPDLHCFRIPGLRKPRCGDVIAFNYPFGRGQERIQFKINYVYLKRCIGCPGDSLSIRGGYYINNHIEGGFPAIQGQHMVASVPDSLMGYGYGCFPNDTAFSWTLKEFGPVLVPGKGICIKMDPYHARLYSYVIEYETGSRPSIQDGTVLLENRPAGSYIFRENYYFMAGDNVLNSSDSRYFGFVPERFIIGRVPVK